MTRPAEPCPGCGLLAPGGAAGCQAIFDELLARDFSEPLYFAVHRMLVDTYCLQHPERYCKSAKSLAAHLVGLCSILERGASRAAGEEALRRWLDGKSPIEKPELPALRGALTIADVRAAATPEAHAVAVERWARSTWQAYSALHGGARQWLEQALATEPVHAG